MRSYCETIRLEFCVRLLLAGVLIGPYILSFIGEEGGDIMHFAEFGVVMMLFFNCFWDFLFNGIYWISLALGAFSGGIVDYDTD